MRRRLSYRVLPLLMLALLASFSSRSVVQAADENPAPAPPAQMAAAGEQPGACQALMTQIDEQNRLLSQELRQIKRELAALNQNLEKPGIKEVMAGIGTILGLFGVAAFVAARRRDRKPKES